MKKILCNLTLVFALMLGMFSFSPQDADAVSFSVGTKDNRNGTVTITVSGQCVGAFNVSANGKTAQLAIRNLGGSDSTTLKTGVGTFKVTVTAISISDADYNVEENKTITKTVTVTDKSLEPQKPTGGNNGGSTGGTTQKPNPTPTPQPQKPQPTKSKVNTLDLLAVDVGELSPKFDKTKTTYSVEVTDSITSINIEAKATDSKSKVTGDGKQELHVGENNFRVLVTSESGHLRTYTISVYVKETPKIFVSYNGARLGVLTDFGKVELPDRAVKTSVKINDMDCDGVRVGNLTLLYLFDEKTQKADFYIYSDGDVMGKYEYLTGFSQKYIALETEMPNELKNDPTTKEVSVKLGETTVKGFKSENIQYPVVYLMNENGQKAWYSYDESEETLQKWDFDTVSVVKKDEKMEMVVTALAIATAFSMIGLIYQTYRFNKFKKLSLTALREYDKSHQSQSKPNNNIGGEE